MDVKEDPLLEVGTRFKHLTDLLDKWNNAVETVRKAYNSYPNKADQLKLARLEAGAFLLRSEMATLSKMEMEEWKLRNLIDAMPAPLKTKKAVPVKAVVAAPEAEIQTDKPDDPETANA